MVLRCIKGIWKYIKRVDILLWLIVAAISAYSLVLLRSVDSAVGSSYFRTQVFAIALGVAGPLSSPCWTMGSWPISGTCWRAFLCS